MPKYIKKQLQKYQHEMSKRPQHFPYPSAPKKYGTSEQEPLQTDDSNTSGPKGITRVKKLFVRILYYARSIDTTILISLSTLDSEKSKATTQTITNLNQPLN